MQKYSSVAIDAFGNVLAGASVFVYNAGTAVLATIYSDNGLTPKFNPFITASNGAYTFYAANGRYDVVLTKTGFTFVNSDTSDLLLFDSTGVAGTQFGGHIFGLTLSNNVGDAVNDIDIATGEAVSDDSALANRVLMSLAVGLTKQLDATWAAGTNAGMRDTSDTLAGAKWFHIFEFVRGNGTTDIFASTSLAPLLPDGGTKKRRIGSIYWTGATIKAFTQLGDEFLWKSPVLDVNITIVNTTANTALLLVPTGLKVTAKVQAEGISSGSLAAIIYVSSLDVTDEAASPTAAPLSTVVAFGASQGEGTNAFIRTNTNANIRWRASSQDGSTQFRLATLGWIDDRGRLY